MDSKLELSGFTLGLPGIILSRLIVGSGFYAEAQQRLTFSDLQAKKNSSIILKINIILLYKNLRIFLFRITPKKLQSYEHQLIFF